MTQTITLRRKPSRMIALRQLLAEMNIGYTIQQDFKTGDEIGFYCIATSYFRKNSALERIAEFIKSNSFHYNVIDAEGLTFLIQ